MKLTRISALTSLVVATAIVGAGAVQAAPAPQDIKYQTNVVEKTIVTTLDGGTFKIDAAKKTVEIVDKAGNPAVSLPLSFVLGAVSHPIDAKVEGDGTVLKLTPNMDRSKAHPVFLKRVASPVEDQRALSQFSSYFGVGTAVGTFVGTAVGALIGCVATIAAGCIPGATAGAGIGGIAGTVVVGGPVLAYSAIDLVNTLMGKPGTSKYADKTYNVAPKSTTPAAPKKPAAEELPAADSAAPEAVPAG